MKLSTLTLDSINDREQLVTLEVVLGSYLQAFTADAVANAAQTSALEKARTLFNQVQNLLHGSHLHYNITRLPLLAYKVVSA